MYHEEDIIRQLKNGHSKALNAIMTAYKDYVYSILVSMISHEEAEEACQDTFVKVFRRINTYSEKSKFSTWLYTIAYRTGLDYLKKKNIKTNIIEEQADRNFLIDQQLTQNDLVILIERFIQFLNPRDAGLLRLYYLNEYSIEEVSEITGMSPSNVKVKLFRIRKSLRDRFAHVKLTNYLN